jgi:hypothetical protein
MRHSDPGGRFTVSWEHFEILRGIDGDLRAPVGQHVQWIEYDSDRSKSDVIYDVADNVEAGRQWKDPRRIPAYAAISTQGVSLHNERGFYNTDTLRVLVAMNVIEDMFPELAWQPDTHIKDRILYRGKVFVPTRIAKNGILRNTYTTLTVDANQVNHEEFVNDPQLFEWANRDIHPPYPYNPQRIRQNSTL